MYVLFRVLFITQPHVFFSLFLFFHLSSRRTQLGKLSGMAGLEKMALRGIRSFSPDDEQTIEFYSPLTMIVGQNGSGKTTIIECLKYACTGKLPPGGASTSGQSWIHDPKLTDDTEVKASIKLRFKARDGKRMVVVRSLQLQYKGKSKNPTFKQLEGVIKTINPVTKKSESLGHKCQDLNAFVPQATDISAAILESVVFCHQEESSWPLQDGATLKKKFDDIFESARYTKALEAIEKCRKGRAEELKNLRLDLAALTENRETASDIRHELERKTAEIQDIQAKQETVADRINTLQARLRQAEEALVEVKGVLQALGTNEMLVKERTRAVAEKKKSLGCQEMEGETDESLQERLASFAKEHEDVQRELTRLRQKETTHKKATENYRAEMQRMVGQRGELKAQMGQVQQLMADRNREIVAVCDAYALPLPRTLAGTLSQASGTERGDGGNTAILSHVAAELPVMEIKRFFSDFQGKQETLSQELEAFKTEQSRCLTKKRAEMTELEAKLLANESGKTARQAEMRKIEEKYTEITNELHRQAAVPASVLSSMQQEVERARTDYEVVAAKGKGMEFEKTVKNLEKTLREVAVELDGEQKVWESMKENSKERTEYDVNQREHASKMERLEAEVARFNSSMYRPFLSHDLAPDLNTMQQAVTELNANLIPTHATAVKTQADALVQARQELTEIGTNQARDKREADMYAAEIDGLEKRSAVEKARHILEALQEEFAEKIRKNPEKYPYRFDDRDIEGALREVQAVVDTDIRSLHEFRTKKGFCELLIDQSKEASTCMCCTTPLNAKGVELLEESLATGIRKWTDKVQKLEVSLPRHQQQLADLRACATDVKELIPLRAKLREVEERMNFANEQNAKWRASVGSLEEEMVEKERQKKKVEECLAQVTGMSSTCAELYKKREELDFKRKRLQTYSVDGDERGLEAVEASLKSLRATQTETNRHLQETQAEQSKAAKRMINQAELVRAAEAALEEKVKMMSRSQELEQEKTRLKARQCEVEAEVQLATEEEIPLRQALKQYQADFETLKVRLDAEEADKQRKRIECIQRYQGFDALQCKLQDWEKKGLGTQLVELEAAQARLKQDLQGVEGQLEELAPQIQVVANRSEGKDQLRRQIEDNVTYRRMLSELEKEKEELAMLRKRVDENEEKEALERALDKVQNQYRDAREMKIRNEARIDTLTAVQQEQQAKLRSDKLKNIEKRFRNVKIMAETTMLAVEDLQKYHKVGHSYDEEDKCGASKPCFAFDEG